MKDYFSATYSDARAQFLSACLDAKATVKFKDYLRKHKADN